MNTLDERFTEYIGRNGETVLVDGNSRTVFFMSFKEGITILNDYMYLFTQAGEVSTGVIIERNDTKYLVTHQEGNINGVYDKFLIREITKELNFIIDNEAVAVPSIIYDGVQRVSDSSYLSVFEGKLEVMICDTTQNQKIEANDRFITFGNAWKVIGITKTDKGLIKLHCDKDLIADDDDMENEIPKGIIIEEPTPTGAYYIDGKADIKCMSLETFTGIKIENDIIIPSVWAFTLEDNENDVEFSITGDDTCTIKSQESSGNIVLTGVCDGETIIKEIDLEGLW
ncbi:hypothetical protein SAMN02745751_01615 [Dethiosulfatibacter aminovorans DSM 17477]|uniref:Uncharacterized protein n=1 Tax=Dethiosulfatibacter aminovorans DSM 17477 TaxID=1121476 RepID=A0A1M6G0U9_9FIRM|nr:hypothetical protein [Dethiosulfatibacter aminovorans]SHJ03550.1 hypothetical protein SAMN02745751_01615 [Dethiosulfatibacter aminovorans DSM 17477]